MALESFGDLAALSNLLEESEAASSALNGENQQEPKETFKAVVKTRADFEKEKAEKAKVVHEKASTIFTTKEVPNLDALHIKEENDSRPTPRYEFSYKQMVGTSDTLLGMSDKTPGSQDCSHLIVKVHFPNSTMKDLDLDVTRNRIRAESKSLKLFTYLPNDVYHEKGNAKFDSSKHVLIVTLPIVGMFDDMT